MQTLLLVTGLVLFLIGLLTGLAIPAMKNPRMGLSSHLGAHFQGLFLLVIGLLWSFVNVTPAWETAAVALLVYAAYANWVATLIAGIWGAGRPMMPLAAPTQEGSPALEGVIKFLLITLSIADIVGVAIVLFGLLHN